MRYSFDTSAFIEGQKRYYRPANFPSLWKHIEALITSGHLRSCDVVLSELEKVDDGCLAWAKQQDGLFLMPSQETQAAVGQVMARHPKLVRNGRSGADPWVIAMAIATGTTCAVVTDEKPKSLINPHIPDVCGEMGIPCMTLAEVVEREGWAF